MEIFVLSQKRTIVTAHFLNHFIHEWEMSLQIFTHMSNHIDILGLSIIKSRTVSINLQDLDVAFHYFIRVKSVAEINS